eukprot:TRINITY_DN7980_c0_g1_i2.p1 TRINITY_DN7980_c0_g1~~TRINITY_DN7980_c0_g1_i2.p1  ORF type:complete len:147 (-),score=12.35 TRINITY_DN7980_c0_g1_i2:91-483(-)
MTCTSKFAIVVLALFFIEGTSVRSGLPVRASRAVPDAPVYDFPNVGECNPLKQMVLTDGIEEYSEVVITYKDKNKPEETRKFSGFTQDTDYDGATGKTIQTWMMMTLGGSGPHSGSEHIPCAAVKRIRSA